MTDSSPRAESRVDPLLTFYDGELLMKVTIRVALAGYAAGTQVRRRAEDGHADLKDAPERSCLDSAAERF